MGQLPPPKLKLTPTSHKLVPLPRNDEAESSRHPRTAFLPIQTVSAPEPPRVITRHPRTAFPPIQTVSVPEPPRVITRMSTLIDPEDLILEEAWMDEPFPNPSQTNPQPRLMVQSPSGNLLSPTEYRVRPDRRLTVSERKQAIRDETRRKIGLEAMAQAGAEAEAARAKNQEGEKRNCRKCDLGTLLRTCGCGLGKGSS